MSSPRFVHTETSVNSLIDRAIHKTRPDYQKTDPSRDPVGRAVMHTTILLKRMGDVFGLDSHCGHSHPPENAALHGFWGLRLGYIDNPTCQRFVMLITMEDMAVGDIWEFFLKETGIAPGAIEAKPGFNARFFATLLKARPTMGTAFGLNADDAEERLDREQPGD